MRPTAEQVAIGVGHPEHVGDHLEGEREREIGDDLQVLAACDDGVERVVDERLHARRELLDGSWGEDLLDDPADARVVGRIEVEDAAGSPLGAVAEHLLAELGAWVDALDARVLHAELRITQEPDAVVVAEEHPRTEQALLHGVVLDEEPVLAVRICGESGLERIEGGPIRGAGRYRITSHISNTSDGCGRRPQT